MLETLNGISVPKAPQGNTFTYHANAKEIMVRELEVKKRQAYQIARRTNGGELGPLL